jgi:tetratricopeptide (TPR) repeat protein
MTWVRRLLLPTVLVAAVAVAGSFGRVAGGVAVAAGLAFLAGVFVLLPRRAHAAFERGDHGRAELYYRILRAFVAAAPARGAIDVSLAGCRLARSDWRGALAELERVEPAALGVAARAAWHNNRAYALARGEGEGPERLAALASVDEAIRLRPDLAGFRHTRGVVLLALGRLEDAIAELDEVWHQVATGDAPPLLEAERCFDLGLAWTRKGEPDYARDYFHRALLVAPTSPWAASARAALERAGRA